MLKNDNLFLEKTAYACESCYLDITKYCTIAGVKPAYLIDALKPSILPKRNMTADNKLGLHKKNQSMQQMPIMNPSNMMSEDKALNKFQIIPYNQTNKLKKTNSALGDIMRRSTSRGSTFGAKLNNQGSIFNNI